MSRCVCHECLVLARSWHGVQLLQGQHVSVGVADGFSVLASPSLSIVSVCSCPDLSCSACMDSLALPSACRPSVHGMLCVCHDRLPMLLFVSSSFLLVRTVSCRSSRFARLCSCLKTSSLPSVGSRNHAQWAARRLSNRRQCGRHPCFGCTSGTLSARSFDSCSVIDSLQRQLYA
jgi:hypothetical protein